MLKEIYFNFHVALMQGVLTKRKTVQSFISDAMDFHVYSHRLNFIVK